MRLNKSMKFLSKFPKRSEVFHWLRYPPDRLRRIVWRTLKILWLIVGVIFLVSGVASGFVPLVPGWLLVLLGLLILAPESKLAQRLKKLFRKLFPFFFKKDSDHRDETLGV